MSAQETDPAPPPKPRRYGLILLIVAIALAVSGIAERIYARNQLGLEAAAAAILPVVLVKPGLSTSGEELVLPGNLQAFNSASIYARTSGYLKAWYVDIGTPVKKGQLLAEIDTPEVDQQLRQALADLATAQANYNLAKSTDARWQGLLATESVSKQDADEKAGDAAAKKASLGSAAANVDRLRELTSFKRVVAPFDGIVVARNTDIGALINAGESSGTELFRVADTRKLRAYVEVPQSDAAATTPGLRANLILVEHPGRSYPAKLARTANAIDPVSHSLQVELEVDNSKAELLPGAYIEVHFKLPVRAESLRVPPTAVLFRSAGLQVATVGADHRVVLKTVIQGRDFGNSIEILSGIGPHENIISNPPDSIADGVPVRPVETQKEKP